MEHIAWAEIILVLLSLLLGVPVGYAAKRRANKDTESAGQLVTVNQRPALLGWIFGFNQLSSVAEIADTLRNRIRELEEQLTELRANFEEERARRSRVEDQLDKMIRTFDMPAEFVQPDGTTISVRVIATAVRDENGDLDHFTYKVFPRE